MDIVVDAGNTNVKIGVYREGQLSDILRIRYENLRSSLSDFFVSNVVDNCIISSVGPDVAWDRLIVCKKMLKLSIRLPLIIPNAYILSG